MIKEDWTESSQSRVCADEESPSSNMRALMSIYQELEDGDIGNALHSIRFTQFVDPLQDLLEGLQKRLMLTVLRMVEHTYVNISTAELAELLDIEEESELQEVSLTQL
ncbi:unnamed protein product [Gongylonema pulchrum]|uniref:CSN8_PSD8_EIF3K domain-containing protein n=1 Tax=Gongylonema pulchrum TaxID=637853 RepID=A0A183EYJ2_9BILA|nr:unnamed protein product [Gongylonema pulchrum]